MAQKMLGVVGVLVMLSVLLCGPAQAHYYTKLVPGIPFTFFELEDLNHQRWVSTYLRGKPVVILTGHRYQKYEIMKWAENLRRDFWSSGAIHLLWVVNTSKFPFSTSRRTINDEWRRFNAPVPVVMDWHGVVGKSLRINYGIPNIIAIDAAGRFAFHEMHSFSPGAYASIADRINALLGATPGMLKPAAMTPVENRFSDQSPLKGGKKGDSY
jgi:hypothetical protein